MKTVPASHNDSPIFLAIGLLLIFIMAARTPLDADMWWHLRAGEDTLRSGLPVTQDAYSFTREGMAWTNHSWLSQVIMFAAFDRMGSIGLSLLVSFCAVLSMWLVSLQMTGSRIAVMVLLVLGGMVASVNWVPRPQVITLVLLALCGAMLRRYLRKPDRRIWLLPVIFMLWGNLHGGYALGLLLAGCTAGGAVLSHLLKRSAQLTWPQIFQLILASAAGYLATAINPNGFAQLMIPFKTVGVAGLHNLVSEWAPPDFREPMAQLFLLYLLLLICTLIFSKKPVRIDSLLTLGVFGFLAFTARRNFGPFVLVSLPVMSDRLAGVEIPQKLSGWWEKTGGKWLKPGQRNAPEPVRRGINAVLLVLLVLAAGVKTYSVANSGFVQTAVKQNYPLDAVEWIGRHISPARIMNEYNWGGFLIWRLRGYPLFIDGRTDLYGDEILNEWVDAMQCGPQTRQTLEKWDVHVLMVQPDRPVSACLAEAGWQEVYTDKQATVLTDDIRLLK